MANIHDDEVAGPSRPAKKPKVSRSTRAGLVFPVGRINRYLHNGGYADRIGSGASVYMAAVLQYLVTDIVDIAAATASKDKKRRIAPKHLMWAISNDDEFCNLLGHMVPQVKATRRKTKTAGTSKRGKGKKPVKSSRAVSA